MTASIVRPSGAGEKNTWKGISGDTEVAVHGEGMGTDHVCFGRADEFATDLSQPIGKSTGEGMSRCETGKMVRQAVVGCSGHRAGLSNTTTESFSEPTSLFDECARSDDHTAYRQIAFSHGTLKFNATHEPIGAPIPFDRQRLAVSNGSKSPVKL